MEDQRKKAASPPPKLTDTAVKWSIEDDVVNAVVAAAVWSESRRPGIWQAMIKALYRGAAKTKEGTVNAFLFRGMVDRLLEEFHGLGGAPAE